MPCHCLLIGSDFPEALSDALKSHSLVVSVRQAMRPVQVADICQQGIDYIFVPIRSYSYRLFQQIAPGPKIIFVCGRLDKCDHAMLATGQLMIREPFNASKLHSFLPIAQKAPVPDNYDYIVLMYERMFRKFYFDDIDLIEKIFGNYLRISTTESGVPKVYVIAGSLINMQRQLPFEIFSRVSDGVIAPRRMEVSGDALIFRGRNIRLTQFYTNTKGLENES